MMECIKLYAPSSEQEKNMTSFKSFETATAAVKWVSYVGSKEKNNRESKPNLFPNNLPLLNLYKSD